ncbi:MAG: lipoate--protein ligase family protein [Acidobacteria bacterium]|nr:lipoate--protein ligase family protein [Acidobacteriota bacterium]
MDDGDPRATWRLIEDPPADGFRNMGVDEALLESCDAGAPGFPVLRLYGFSPPCLSIGFSQELDRAADLAACRDAGLDVVRRPTGGRAVLHDDEITYAVIGRRGDAPFDGSLLDAYGVVAQGLLAGFARLGVRASIAEQARDGDSHRESAICFSRPSRHEIVASGAKVVGSSSARRRGAFLQHGSIPRRFDRALLTRATGGERAGEKVPDVPGLARLAGRDVTLPEIAAALGRGFEQALGVRCLPGSLSPAEAGRGEWLRAHRYLTSAWTGRR